MASPVQPGRPHNADAHAAVKRELLVRLLDGWLPTALHGAGRAMYLDACPSAASIAAVLRVTSEFSDLFDQHRLDVIVVDTGDDPGLTAQIAASRRLHTVPAGVAVQIVPAASGRRTPVLRVPPSAPMLAYLDLAAAPPPDPAELAYLVTGARTQALLVVNAATLGGAVAADYEQTLTGASGALVSQVELVAADGRVQVVFFRTTAVHDLEAFKDALWAVDEYAGVRYRDPGDPEHALLDISLSPHPGPLRRALLSYLADAGARTVAQLRHYALTKTVYRIADVAPTLTAMVAAGTVRRAPAKGRLTVDAVISLP